MASNTEWLETEYQAAWKAMQEAQKEAQYREIALMMYASVYQKRTWKITPMY